MSSSVIIYDTNKEESIKEVQINEDVTSLESNSSFILVGTLKGKVFIYDDKLSEIAKIQLATFRISTLRLIP
jgi:hypothetical protein